MKKQPKNGSTTSKLVVPSSHWEDLMAKDLDLVADRSLARMHMPEGLVLRFLNRDILVDIENHQIKHEHHRGQWHPLTHPLLELMILVYLLNASPESPGQDLISVNELKDAHFFQGAHAVPIGPVLSRYGRDIEGFKKASEKLSGESVDHADAAFRFYPFPKIPLYYLLWEGDDEFEPNVSILFDRTIEEHLAADAILGTVNLVSQALVTE